MNTMKQDKQYWQRLSERYFEAGTTDSEEEQLRHFAATTDDPDFDELRAVMGFAAMGRKIRNSNTQTMGISAPQPGWSIYQSHRRITGIAASLLLVLGLLAYFMPRQQEPDCVAYVNGREVTNPDQVMALMQQTMLDVQGDHAAEDPIETQLREMFELN